MKWLTEIAFYGMFAAFVGLLSAWPAYQLLAEDRAIVSVAFSHAGKRIGDCRMLTQEQLNELPPNMRTMSDCPRERHPVRIVLRSDSETLYDATLQPSGIWADGKSNIYKRIEVSAGTHHLFVGVNDSGDSARFDFEASKIVDLVPGRNLIVQFDEQTQSILIR